MQVYIDGKGIDRGEIEDQDCKTNRRNTGDGQRDGQTDRGIARENRPDRQSDR